MLIHSVSLEESLHLQIAEPSDWVDWIARLDLRALVRVWVAWIDSRHSRVGTALCEPSSCELRLFSLPAELCLHDTFMVLPVLNGWYRPRYVTIPGSLRQRRGSQGLGGTGQGTESMAGIDGCYPLKWLDQPLAFTRLCL